MTTRQFPLAAILSITTGRLLTSNLDDIWDLLDYMTDDTLFTHQLPRVADECKPHLLRQHPDLATAICPADWDDAPEELLPQFVASWLDAQTTRFGDTLPIHPLGPGEHTHVNPLLELAQKLGQTS